MGIRNTKIKVLSYSLFFILSLFLSSISAVPACGTTITSNLTLDGNMYCPGSYTLALRIDGDYVTLDCAGFNITGNGGSESYGIYISHRANTTIKNCNLKGFTYDIVFAAGGGTGPYTINATVTNSSFTSFFSYRATNSFVYNNIINGSITCEIGQCGSIYWNISSRSGPNIVGGPSIGGNYWANPSGNGFSQTCKDENVDGFCDATSPLGDQLALSSTKFLSSCQTLDLPNTVYALTTNVFSPGTCFTIAANNVTLDCQGHTITYAQTTTGYGINITGYNFTTTKNCNIVQTNSSVSGANAIYLSSARNSTIQNNNISVSGSYSYGTYLSSSSYNTFTNNSITSKYYGTYLESSSYNIFLNNNITASDGAYITSSSNNTFASNSISNNGLGIFFSSSSYNNIIDSNITSSYRSIGFYSNSNYNKVTNNRIITLDPSDPAIYIDSSNNNILYNNLINATRITDSITSNTWNTTKNCTVGPNIVGGPCIGGNFYANSTGGGFSETCIDTDGDGICNSPSQYQLAPNNIDYLPLSMPPIQVDSCRTLDQAGKTYVLTQNVSSNGTCFTIAANNVTLDCQGHTINYSTSSTGYGVYINGYNFNTIKNCNILQTNSSVSNAHAIYLANSNNIFVQNSNISTTGDSSYGAFLLFSSNSTFINNSIFNIGTDSDGIHFDYSASNINITSNNINSTNGKGLSISYSFNNTFINNSITAFYEGANFYSGSNNIFINNNISSGGNGILVQNSNYNTVTNNNILATYRGAFLSSSSNNTFINNSITSTSSNGAYLSSSSNYNTFTNNTITSTNHIGAYLSSSSYNTFTNNSISSTSGYGAYLESSSNNTFTNNTISSTNESGAFLFSSSNNTFTNNNISSTNSYGAYLSSSSNYNTFTNNTITSTNHIGAYLSSSSYNNFTNNNISSTNSYGAYLSYSSNNNFTNNTISSTNYNGVRVYSSSDNNTFTNNIVKAGTIDFVSSGSSGNTIINMTFNSTVWPTTASFTYSGDVSVDSANAVPSPGFHNVSKYLDITNQSSGAWIYINFSYSNDTIGGNETKLKLYRWNGSNWNYVPGSAVDTVNKIVYGNITQFSIFAPLAVADVTPPSIQLISPANDTYTNDDNMTFIFNATDDQSATLNCSLYINNILNRTNSSVSNGSIVSFALTSIPDGDYTWYINCSDASGNANVSETRTFTIDKYSPFYPRTCSDLVVPGAEYRMTRNLYASGTCFRIVGAGVIFDCQGNTIYYANNSAGYAVTAANASSFTIKNCRMQQINSSYSTNAMYLYNTSYALITNNTINVTNGNGIYLDTGLGYDNITMNDITANGHALYLGISNTRVVSNNITSISGSYPAIRLYGASFNYFEGNRVNGSYGDAYIRYGSNNTFFNNSFLNTGISIDQSANNVFNYNFINATGSSKAISTCAADNTIISNNTIVGSNGISLGIVSTCNSGSGIKVLSNSINVYRSSIAFGYSTSNTLIDSNTLISYNQATIGSSCEYGMSDITITNNNISNSWGSGIELSCGVYNSRILNNSVNVSSASGISIGRAHHILISGNNVTAQRGLSLVASSHNITVQFNNFVGSSNEGIYVSASNNNSFISNNVTSQSSNAITVTSYSGSPSSLNVFENNRVSAPASGTNALLISGSNSNRFTSNIFNSTGTNGAAINLQSNSLYNNFTSNIIYSNYSGVIFSSSSNNSLTFNNVTSINSHGISFSSNSNYNTLANNNITSTSGQGVYLTSSSYNNFTNNYISSINGKGAYLYSGSNNNTFTLNNISSTSSDAVTVESSSYNTFTNNRINGRNYGLDIYSNSNSNTFINNNISGTNFYGLHLYSCSNNNFSYNNITSSNGGGVYFESSASNILLNNIINGSGYGISFSQSSNNNLENNQISGSGFPSVNLYYSNSNNFTDNTIYNDQSNAVHLTYTSSYNVFIMNNITTTSLTNPGLYLEISSNYNNFTNNSIISTNNDGLHLDYSSNNTFINNIIKSGITDFVSSGSSENTIINMTFNSTAYPTTASFTYSGDINVDSADAVQSLSLLNVSKYLNITNQSAGAWIYINFSYSNDTIGSNETKLKLYRWNGSNWNYVPGSAVDPVKKIVYGNVTQFSIFAPLADVTPPTVNISSPTSNSIFNNTLITISGSSTDDYYNFTNISIWQGSTLINSTITTDASWSIQLGVPEDGAYNITATAYDLTGNNASDSVQNIIIDTTLPSVSITSPISDSYLASKLITINGSSSDLNYNFTNISIWQGSTLINSTTTTNTSWSLTLSVPSDGNYNITATAYDNASNSNSTTVTNIIVDTILPSVFITFPTSDSYLTSRSIAITGASSDTNLNFTNISIWQGSTLINSTTTTNTSWSLTLSVPSDGNYNITATAYDNASNSNSTSVTNVIVDTIYPQVSIISPLQSNPIYLRSSVPAQIKFNYNETNPANYTLLLINSSGSIVSIKSDNLSISGDVNVTDSLDTTGLPNGNYSVNISVFDLAGHETKISELNNVIIDNEIPGVIINYPHSDQYIIGDTIELNLTVFDDNLNYTLISIYNASESILNYTTTQSGTFVIDFTLPDGIYSINVTSYDLSGNNASASVSGIELDTISPFYPNQCLQINLPGEYYLSSDIYSNETCFIIAADDVLLDGQGRKITNTGSGSIPGIYAENRDNITIQNLIMQGFDPDIALVNVTNATILNVTHNGGQLQLLNSEAVVLNSRFENSTSEGIIANRSNVIINNTIIKNSQSVLLLIDSSTINIENSYLESYTYQTDALSFVGTGSTVTAKGLKIAANNSFSFDIQNLNDISLTISNSNISAQNSVINLQEAAGFESKNITIKLFRNNVNFTKIASSDSLVNASGKIILTEDIYGNFWGRNSYPYINSSIDFVNVTDAIDQYPYSAANGWDKEARFRLNSSSYNFVSKDGRLSIFMPLTPYPHDNLVLSRLVNEVFVITDAPLMYLASENALINSSLHYKFGTYESLYLPPEEREGLTIVSAQPIQIEADLSGLLNESDASHVSMNRLNEKGEWPFLGAKFIFNSTDARARTKLNFINGSIDFVIGKKVSDLIRFDNASPTVSMSQSGSVIVASYSDPLQEVIQLDNGEGINYTEVHSDRIIPLFLPSGAVINNASITLAPISGTPSFNVSIYLRNNITSLSPAERYYFQEVSSLSDQIQFDVSSSLSAAMSNCSQLHNGSYCLLYIAINGLTGGTLNISGFYFNYSYSSGIKLPDVNTSSTISSLVEIPNSEPDSVYLLPGGTSVLMLSLPIKAYIKSAQITLVGEEWEGSYPSDVSFWIGDGSTAPFNGTPIMTYNGQFNTSVQIISSFANALRGYLSSTDSDQEGRVMVPLTFNSSSKGKVRIASITVDYDLRNAYDLTSPSYIDGFSDGTETKSITFTSSSPSSILYIAVPKYSKVLNISLIANPSENITFDVDFLNDGIMEIQNSTSINAINLTSYLQNCNPYKFMVPYGRMCIVPINITANLGSFSSVDSEFEVSSEFISVPWAYAGSDSELIRGTEKRYDFLSIPSSAAKRARSLSLEHHSIYSLQSGDIVIGYAFDMAGNRGSGQYIYLVAAPPSATSPAITPPSEKVPISGFMNFTGSLAYIVTEPNAYVTVIYKSTGAFVTGGYADSNGRFEFTPPYSGEYKIRVSKSGFEDNEITLTAQLAQIETQISGKRIVDCSSGTCKITLSLSTNKVSDFQFSLTSFIPSSIIKTIKEIKDRLGNMFYSYSYTDSLISIPASRQITSSFSVIIDSVLSASTPTYDEKENKLTFTISNPAEDMQADEIVIPLPESVRGKEISSIEYIAADGSKTNITNYVVESDRIVVKQTVVVKKQ